MTMTSTPGVSAVVRLARSPATKTLMWRRMRGVESQRRSRNPGQRASSPSIASPTVAAASSTRRGQPGKSRSSSGGRWTATAGVSGIDDQRLDRRDAREILRDHLPALAFIGAREECAAAGAEIDAGGLERIARHRLAEHADIGMLLWQALAQRDPALPAVAGAPHRRLRVRHIAAGDVAIERQEKKRAGFARMGCRGKAEARGQPCLDAR